LINMAHNRIGVPDRSNISIAMKSSNSARNTSGRGYAMVALLVAIGVMSVMMTVSMPIWKQVSHREKEEELIFRGEQYAHAISLFQRKFANAMPPNVDVLVEQRFLRKKYKDPVTNDDFVPLTLAQAGRAGAPAPGTPPGRSSQAPPGTSVTAGRDTPEAGGVEALRAGLLNAIIGVTSKSKDKSIRSYKGRNHYNEWAFISVAQTQTPGAGAPGSATPGMPGQRGQRQELPGGAGRGRGRGARGGPGSRGVSPPAGFDPLQPQTPTVPPLRGRSGG
jgi:type II secretory pathway pseudopilin PulG